MFVVEFGLFYSFVWWLIWMVLNVMHDLHFCLFHLPVLMKWKTNIIVGINVIKNKYLSLNKLSPIEAKHYLSHFYFGPLHFKSAVMLIYYL